MFLLVIIAGRETKPGETARGRTGFNGTVPARPPISMDASAAAAVGSIVIITSQPPARLTSASHHPIAAVSRLDRVGKQTGQTRN